MNHYIVDGLFLVFGVLTVVICAKRGLFLTVLKFFKMLLAVGGAYLWGSAFGSFLSEKILSTPIREAVYNKVNQIYLSTADSFNAESALEAVPDFLLNDEMRAKLNALEGSGEELVNSVTNTVAGSLSSVLGAILGYIAVFVVIFLVLSIVYVLVKGFRNKIKIIGVVDGILGGVLGFVLAWICLLVIGSVLRFFLADDPIYTDSVLVKFFGNSSILDGMKMLNVNEWLSRIQSIES